MSGERVGFRFKHADAVVKRNPQGRSRRGWVMEPVEQTTSRGTKMPAYRIRWRDSCLLYTSPSPRDLSTSRMPSSA